jgi:myo-inositol 2-dehydrogenase / D-chiro-inositol 1-dehydrogenase
VTAPIGVGFLGAGPVTQAVHVPALATLGDRFRIVKVMDLDKSVAQTVAERSAAIPTTSVADVLNDPAVEVVAVNSPRVFHADQVVAACAAGKRAILCEKPLALTAEEGRRVATASATTGVPIVVGTMHTYDPAAVAALEAWAEVGERAHIVRSLIYLPDNAIFTNLATEITPSPDGRTPSPDAPTLGDAVLGLAIHAVPLVRRLVPDFDGVATGRQLGAFGYFLTLSSGTTAAQMIGLIPTQWEAYWSLRAISDQCELSITFPPSYVLAGSAVAELSGPDGTRRWRFNENGYQAEWSEIEAIVRHGAQPRFAIADAVDDLDYALRLIEGSTRESESA